MQRYEINKEESARLNALKVLMCIFVLMIHIHDAGFATAGSGTAALLYRVTFVISEIICNCAVPVFILISSVLLYAKPFEWRANVVKKARSLLPSYFIFNTLWLVPVFLKHVIAVKLGVSISDDVDLAAFSLFDWLDAYLGLAGDYNPLLVSLWYIRDLLLLNILAVVIKKLVDALPVPTLIAILALWVLNVPFYVLHANSVPFFVLGYYLVKYDIHFADLDRKLNKYMVTAVFLLLLILDVVLMKNTIPVHRLFILASIVFYIRFSGYLSRCTKVIALILPASFLIYLVHPFVYSVYSAVKVVLPSTLITYLAGYIVVPLLALVCITIAYYLLRRFCPGLLAVLVGGRIVDSKILR